jgi:hypothetical protein
MILPIHPACQTKFQSGKPLPDISERLSVQLGFHYRNPVSPKALLQERMHHPHIRYHKGSCAKSENEEKQKIAFLCPSHD